MYLMEGAGELHRAYDMAVGDVMVFAQKADGQLVVAGRPATKSDAVKRPPIKRPTSKGEGAAKARPRGKPAAAMGADRPTSGDSKGAAKKRARPSGMNWV
jgi:hypothetical protein